MQLTDIRVGTQLFLQPERAMEENPNFELPTKFESSDGDGLFSINEPMWKGQIYTIWPNETVIIRFTGDKKRYAFQGRAVGRYFVKNLPFLQLEQITEIEEVQLRKDFRLEVDDDASLTYTEPGDGGPVVKTRQVKLRDLSGGGASFYSDQYPEHADDMVLEIRTDTGIEKIGAEIRRAVENETRPEYRYLIGTQFHYESSRDKDRVVKYIFSLQQKKIKERGRKGRV